MAIDSLRRRGVFCISMQMVIKVLLIFDFISRVCDNRRQILIFNNINLPYKPINGAYPQAANQKQGNTNTITLLEMFAKGQNTA